MDTGIPTGKKTVAYSKGQVYLYKDKFDDLVEVEILDLMASNRMIKLSKLGTMSIGEWWEDAGEFNNNVKGYLGYFKTVGWSIFKRRVMVRDGN